MTTFRASSPRSEIEYVDTLDHFENGLLRLLQLSRAEFERWLGVSEAQAGSLEERLRRGFDVLRPPPAPRVEAPAACGPLETQGRLLHGAIGENPKFGVAIAEDGSIGWLVEQTPNGWRWVTTPPVYEEAYFEGGDPASGGYGAYAAQAGWRLEKAQRQVRETARATGISTGRALDVGSGYGYFRRALEDAGFAHDGIEISAHARRVARELYGFETSGELLESFAAKRPEAYDLLTLWDVIEHVSDPVELLRACRRCLRSGGAVALKTPNLTCPEAEMFGARYHSFKREHLVYFTRASIASAAELAGLEVLGIESHSHLLRGFFGDERLRDWEREALGADLTAYLRRK